MKLLRTCLLGLLICFSSAASAEPKALIVFAAVSLTDALNEIGDAFTQQTHLPVKFSFAASSALARQIEAGAPAHVFFSADTEWMDYLQSRDLIERDTRKEVVGNALVLIAPASSHLEMRIEPNMPIVQALQGGRLATGDPDSVPLGKYAQAALTRLGVWNEVSARLVRADNARSALAFVARAEAPLGIVYQTDARIERNVRIVATFPTASYPPIIYPAAAVKGAGADAQSFVVFLQGRAAQMVFRKYGFPPASNR
jgi:molybdate transport system substrate-binding protein